MPEEQRDEAFNRMDNRVLCKEFFYNGSRHFGKRICCYNSPEYIFVSFISGSVAEALLQELMMQDHILCTVFGGLCIGTVIGITMRIGVSHKGDG